eukprot:sb/3479448/
MLPTVQEQNKPKRSNWERVEADLIDSGILNEDELDKAIENLKTKVDEITNDLKEIKLEASEEVVMEDSVNIIDEDVNTEKENGVLDGQSEKTAEQSKSQYSCGKCDRIFASAATSAHHEKSCTSVKRPFFLCSSCGSKFLTSWTLRNHLKTSTKCGVQWTQDSEVIDTLNNTPSTLLYLDEREKEREREIKRGIERGRDRKLGLERQGDTTVVWREIERDREREIEGERPLHAMTKGSSKLGVMSLPGITLYFLVSLSLSLSLSLSFSLSPLSLTSSYPLSWRRFNSHFISQKLMRVGL